MLTWATKKDFSRGTRIRSRHTVTLKVEDAYISIHIRGQQRPAFQNGPGNHRGVIHQLGRTSCYQYIQPNDMYKLATLAAPLRSAGCNTPTGPTAFGLMYWPNWCWGVLGRAGRFWIASGSDQTLSITVCIENISPLTEKSLSKNLDIYHWGLSTKDILNPTASAKICDKSPQWEFIRDS